MSRTQAQPGSPSAVGRTISSLTTASSSSTVDQDDAPSSRPRLEVHIPSRAITLPLAGNRVSQAKLISSLTSNASPVRQNHQYTLSSRASQVYFGSSSPITGAGFTSFISSLGASNSSTFNAMESHVNDDSEVV